MIEICTNRASARLKRNWRSPIYLFFKDNIKIEVVNDRRSHFFQCGASTCKYPAGGVRRFLDKKDRASTANLKAHAIKCWGAEAVRNACNDADAQISGSIFAAFARQGQRPVHVSNRVLTTTQARALLVKWITESNR